MTDQTETPSAAPNPFDTELLIKQARSYLAFGEQMSAFSSQLHDNLQSGGDWGAVLRQNFDQFKAATIGAAGDASAAPEHGQLWTQMLDLWRQSTSSLGLGAPAGGETEAWQGYLQVQNQYLDLLRQSASSALDLLEQQLHDRAASGKSIDSLRELYNLWVDCNEKTYGQMLRGLDYSELNGRLFNSLLQCYPKGETRS
ncbi:MAG: poly(R)-hydroxyalkanoic acid synthase subunit PhaE [Candidatus Competibacter sp.]|nr:hypothetical protein [Candidatus Competibacteraceae bacterium]